MHHQWDTVDASSSPFTCTSLFIRRVWGCSGKIPTTGSLICAKELHSQFHRRFSLYWQNVLHDQIWSNFFLNYGSGHNCTPLFPNQKAFSNSDFFILSFKWVWWGNIMTSTRNSDREWQNLRAQNNLYLQNMYPHKAEITKKCTFHCLVMWGYELITKKRRFSS